jgi:hypothetical protein
MIDAETIRLRMLVPRVARLPRMAWHYELLRACGGFMLGSPPR